MLCTILWQNFTYINFTYNFSVNAEQVPCKIYQNNYPMRIQNKI